MNELTAQIVINTNGHATTTSKVVADHFGKVHRDVIRAINNLDCSEAFRARNFAQSSYRSPQNKIMNCVEMTRDGFCFLAMGFTGSSAAKWKEAFINAFNELEANNDSKSVMAALAEAIYLMEEDKAKASVCGQALSRWKVIRKQHMQEIDMAHNKAQMVLNFAPRNAE